MLTKTCSGGLTVGLTLMWQCLVVERARDLVDVVIDHVVAEVRLDIVCVQALMHVAILVACVATQRVALNRVIRRRPLVMVVLCGAHMRLPEWLAHA